MRGIARPAGWQQLATCRLFALCRLPASRAPAEAFAAATAAVSAAAIAGMNPTSVVAPDGTHRALHFCDCARPFISLADSQGPNRNNGQRGLLYTHACRACLRCCTLFRLHAACIFAPVLALMPPFVSPCCNASLYSFQNLAPWGFQSSPRHTTAALELTGTAGAGKQRHDPYGKMWQHTWRAARVLPASSRGLHPAWISTASWGTNMVTVGAAPANAAARHTPTRCIRTAAGCLPHVPPLHFLC